MKKHDLLLNISLILLSVLGFVAYNFYFKGSRWEGESFSVILAITAFTTGSLFTFIKEYRKNLLVAFKCYFTNIREQDVYVSLSYLFRIKLEGDNKYLMVKGNRIGSQYQPVGGVYKRYSSSDGFFIELNARGARLDENNADDLRLYVKGRNVPKVIKWYLSRKNREIDVWREFHEELISSNILPPEHFRYIKPEYLYSRHERLINRRGIQGKQYLIYDIYTISFSDDQRNALRNLFNDAEFTESYAFVNEDDLDRELFYYDDEEYPLGLHAKYLIYND